MSRQRTQPEVDAEIAALTDCLAYIPKNTLFGDDNHARVRLQIEFLRGELDTTAEEFGELSDGDQAIVLEAEGWLEGQTEESPASAWDDYKPKVARPKPAAKAPAKKPRRK